MSPNLKAFLDMLAYSEIGRALLDVSDDGYNVIVGSTANFPDLFTSYADHPRKLVTLKNGIQSTAAGRYQILAHYFDHYKLQLALYDFGKVSQDMIAMQLIKECRAIADIELGHISTAIIKCRSRWASLPGADYPGQHMNPMASLLKEFVRCNGSIT